MTSAPPRRGFDRREQIRTLARLRDREAHDAAQIRLRFVQRAQRRCSRRGENLGARLDQVLRKRCRVVGTATRASHDCTRLHLPQQRADLRQALRIHLELLAHDVRRLLGFAIHSARQCHDAALSSATKS
jgi:hypothetical protein